MNNIFNTTKGRHCEFNPQSPAKSLNHDFDKISKINMIKIFSTETQSSQSCTENNNLVNPENLNKITVQDNEIAGQARNDERGKSNDVLPKGWARGGAFIIMLLVTLFCTAQENSDYKLIAEINKKATFITMDKLGNIYASDGTSIDKYDERGTLLFSYSALSMGRISFIDTYNPLKILVFSKNFMRLLFLDHKLAAQQGAYILSELNILPTCVCMSYDNGFWVYDESVKQLFRYDAQQNLTNKSTDITHFTEKELNPSFIKETESGFLLLNDKENGILVFDRFGTYLKTLPIFTDYFYIMNNQILYIQDDMLKSMHIQTLQQLSITLPETAIQQLCITNKKMVVLTKENTVSVYKITK